MDAPRMTGRAPWGHLLLVLAAALFLRFWGLCHDLPNVFHMDVVKVVETAVRFHEQGHLSPHDWDKPTAHMHLYALMLSAYHGGRDAVVAAANWFGRSFAVTVFGQAGEYSRLVPFESYLVCRITSALLGSLIPVLMFFAAAAPFGRRAGLWGAWLACVCPDLAEFSHTENAYIPLTFFALASYLFTLRAEVRAYRRDLFWAGLLLGVAMQTQFNAIPLGLPLALVTARLAYKNAWETPGALSRSRRVLAAFAFPAAGVALGMVLSDPFILVDPWGFVQGIIDKLTMYSKPYERDWSFDRPIPVEILFYLVAGLSVPVALAAVGGSARLAVLRRWRLLLVLGAFPAAYYLFMARVTVVFPRYFLILLPALLLLAAYALDGLWELFSRLSPWARRTARLLLVSAFIGPGAWEGAVNGCYFRLEDTRVSAGRWLENNALPGSSVFTEKYEPLFTPNRLMRSQVFSLSRFSIEDFRKIGARYLVTCDYQSRRYTKKHFPENFERYRQMDETLRTVARFRMKNLIAFFHPEIKIYELLTPGVPKNPRPALLPLAPKFDGHDVIYADNPVFGNDTTALVVENFRRVTRHLKFETPPEKIGVFFNNESPRPTEMKIGIDGRTRRIPLSPHGSRLELFPLGPGFPPGENLHTISFSSSSGADGGKVLVNLLLSPFDLGIYCLDSGDPETAAACFSRSAAADPDDSLSRLYLALSLARAKDADRAQKALAESKIFDAGHPLARLLSDTDPQEWKMIFYSYFGFDADEIAALRTVRLPMEPEFCTNNKHVIYFPEERTVSSRPNPGETGRRQPVVTVPGLWLERGRYDISCAIRPEGEIRTDSTAAEFSLQPHNTQLAPLTAPVPASVLARGSARISYVSPGYASGFDLEIRTFNTAPFRVGDILIVPDIAASLKAELKRLLADTAHELKNCGREETTQKIAALMPSGPEENPSNNP